MTNKILIILLLFVSHLGFSQTVGKIENETYQDEFEKKKSIDDVSDYWGETIPIVLINISSIRCGLRNVGPDLKDIIKNWFRSYQYGN